MQAQIRRQPDSVQLSYGLPFQSTDAAVYPVPAADGANIVVFGHSNGLSVLKVYGRDQESQRPPSASPGREEDFGDVEDASTLHGLTVTSWLDVPLESPIQHIAFPPVTLASLLAKSVSLPDFLRTHVAVAAAGADSSIHLVSWALDSASDAGGEKPAPSIKITKIINGAASHQDLICSLAVTWTATDHGADQSKSRLRTRGRAEAAEGQQTQYAFLIASSSTTGSGLLVVHEVSLLGHGNMRGHSPTIIARQSMRLPLLKSTLSFSTFTYPSPRHTTLLITSPARGVVKILDVGGSDSDSKRRDSRMEGDTEEPHVLLSAATCLTLYAGYTSNTALPRRKEVLDAKWVMNGRAIVALLEDGEWGVWDVGGAGPSSSGGSWPERSGHGPETPNKFVLRGHVLTSPQKTGVTTTQTSASLAPMTPSRRKSRSADLFGPVVPAREAKPAANPAGRICVCGPSEAGVGHDDAIILSFDGGNNFLPSLQSLWRSGKGDGVATIGAGKGRMQPVPPIRLGGEKQKTISLLHTSTRHSSGNFGTLTTGLDLLVVTDSRLILHTKPETKSATRSASLNLPLRGTSANETALHSRIMNNDLLDLDTMDKMLDRMNNSETQASASTEVGSNLLSWQMEQVHPMDVEMASPTMQKSVKSKLIIDRNASNGRRKLFDREK